MLPAWVHCRVQTAKAACLDQPCLERCPCLHPDCAWWAMGALCAPTCAPICADGSECLLPAQVVLRCSRTHWSGPAHTLEALQLGQAQRQLHQPGGAFMGGGGGGGTLRRVRRERGMMAEGSRAAGRAMLVTACRMCRIVLPRLTSPGPGGPAASSALLAICCSSCSVGSASLQTGRSFSEAGDTAAAWIPTPCHCGWSRHAALMLAAVCPALPVLPPLTQYEKACAALNQTLSRLD